jgi:hypothetical protein
MQRLESSIRAPADLGRDDACKVILPVQAKNFHGSHARRFHHLMSRTRGGPNGMFRALANRPILFLKQMLAQIWPILDSVNPAQYGPRGLEGGGSNAIVRHGAVSKA